MSFIHDALKKSEAERRRGEVPRLQNEPFSPPPRRRPLWPLLLTLALLLNGAVLGWWVLSREEPPSTVAAVAGNPGQTGVGAGTSSREPASDPAAAFAERAPVAMPAAAAPATNPAAVAADPPPSTAHSSPAEPTVTTVVVDERPVAAATPHTGPSPGKTAEQQVTARRAEPPAAARSKAAAAPAVESYPPVADLPGDVRSGLPALDMQLHFFTPVAERRLVRLNGANLREGDSGGDGLSVVEITSDGVKLSRGGVRFFLPAGRH